MAPVRLLLVIAAVAGVIVAFMLVSSLIVNVNADEVVVVQSPISGKLTWYTTAGVRCQCWGKATRYKKREQFWFSVRSDQGGKTDQSIPIRFNDGGHARVSGGISFEMPLDDAHLTLTHTKYGSREAVEQQLIRTVIEKSIYLAGPLMSSTESYAARRSELLGLIEDQILRGVYKSESVQMQDKDPITQQTRTITVVKLVRGKDGQYERQEESPLIAFGVKTFNLLINNVEYDKSVEDQIAAQQQAIMNVQTAIANSKKAEQDAITVAKQGEANAARAKWEQEVVKAQQVTAAEQRKEVARLNAEAADYYKKQQILEGEGDAAKKRLVMEADGALDRKLDAYVKVSQFYADAIKGYQGAWVPSVVMGQQTGSSTAAGGGAQDLINMLSAKTAKDLAVDLSATGAARTKGKQ